MKLCRIILTTFFALAALQMSQRLSYDETHGLRLAAAPEAVARV